MKLSLEQIRDAAWSALRRLLGDGYEWSIVATFEDHVVVRRSATQLESYGISVQANGLLTLGDAAPCEVIYAPLTECQGARFLGQLPVPGADKLSEGERAEKRGSQWAVVLIQEGLSANNRFYTAGALQGAVKLFEGVPAYWTHAASSKAEPDPRDIAGFFTNPAYGLLEGAGGRPGAIMAVFNATDPVARERLLEAFDAGNPKLFGLSINAGGEGQAVRMGQRSVWRVDKITEADSVDLVSKPAAGGRFLRLVAGLTSPVPATEEGLVMFEAKLKKLRESFPALAAKLSANPTEGEVDTLLLEALGTGTQPPPTPATPQKTTPDAGAGQLSEADRSMLREARVSHVMASRTFGRLQEAARASLVSLAEFGADVAALNKHADELVAQAARLADPGAAGSGAGRVAEAAVLQDEVVKIGHALDGFFADKDVEKVGRFRSIREAYIAITGDVRVTGLLREAKGLSRFQEGLQSGTFANVLASSLNRQLVDAYNAQGGAYSDTGAGWLYRTVPANDFRTRERVRFGGYGNLSTVAEGNPYPAMSALTDEKATYAVTKKGGTETLTFEMIRNDDVGAVQEIPRRMAFAARRTLYEFVHGLYATNPTVYDAVALFHATHGGNLGAAALSAAAFSAARLVMMKQAEKDSAKRLGLILRHLMIPVDLWETAYNLFIRNTNLDPQFVQTGNVAPTIHVITHLTDTNDWFGCAGVDQSPQIELAYLDGREDPELFVADIPNAGSLFSADKIDYKLRHIYNGAVLDFRPFFGAFGI